MTLEEAQILAEATARGFGNLECDQCAAAIAKQLGPVFPATFEKLRCNDGTDAIILLERELRITETGLHVGIRIGDVVLDNHHPQGVAEGIWISNFSSLTGAHLNRETRAIAEFFKKVFLTKKFRRWLAAKET